MLEVIREAASQLHFFVAMAGFVVMAGIVSAMGKWAIRSRPLGSAIIASTTYAGAILLLLFVAYALALNTPQWPG